MKYSKSILQWILSIGGLALAFGVVGNRSVQAVPITCPSIYISVNGSTTIYSVDTATAVVTPAATLPVASRIGITAIGGTTPTLYSDSTGTTHITSTNGTTQTNNISATFTGYGGGLGADIAGRLFYFGSANATTNTQTLYRFPTPTSPAAAVTTISSADPIWGKLTPGDMMSDGNGRLYYFGTAAGAPTVNYLFYVDGSNIAYQLGKYTGGYGIGAAFAPDGTMYTLDGTNLYKIDLSNGFAATLIGSTRTAAGTTISGIDMGSCGIPVLNPDFSAQDAIVKQVKNITTGQVLTTQNTAKVGDVLEYQITVKNTGKLPSDSTKFADSIPTGTTYIANSTKMYDSTGLVITPVTNYPDISGAPPFTAAATGTTPATAAGMLINTSGQLAGVVTAGATSAVVIRFRVTVTASNGIIPNTATLTYPVEAAAVGGIPGAFSTASVTSNKATTTLSVNISGTVINDLDLSGKNGGIILTAGELSTNASSTSFYAYLIDSTNKVIASSLISGTGTYSFSNILPNQTGLKIELSTTPPTLPLSSMTVPTPALPTGWKNTAPLLISAVNTALADVPNKDFGIVQGANVILVKRITGIKTSGASSWNRASNPRDNTILNQVVANSADPAKLDYLNPKWPGNYVIGAGNGGKVLPGDEIEYTIYYLNTQGADASKLKICDPIRGKQNYTAGSMQLSAGGATAIGLTDAVDTATGADRANAYGKAALPAVVTAPLDCNIGGPGYMVPTTDRDNGGVAIQLTGTGATNQANLLAIPGATTAATPPASYGWFRFTTKVDP